MSELKKIDVDEVRVGDTVRIELEGGHGTTIQGKVVEDEYDHRKRIRVSDVSWPYISSARVIYLIERPEPPMPKGLYVYKAFATKPSSGVVYRNCDAGWRSEGKFIDMEGTFGEDWREKIVLVAEDQA